MHCEAIRDAGGDAGYLFERLVEDRWVEAEGEKLVAAHDVFADALAARFIFALPNQAMERAGTLLSAACSGGRLGNAFVAIGRLAAHPDFAGMNGEAVIRGLLRHDRGAVLGAHGDLLRGHLLDARAMIGLLGFESDLRAAIADDRDCDFPISYLADVAARTAADDRLREVAIRALRDCLDEGVAHPHPSNIVLRRAFVLEPSRYRDRVLARIASEPAAPQTHYLLFAWGRAHQNITDIGTAVARWLGTDAAAGKASFVYQSWLDAGGETELVREPIRIWLARHQAAPEADFV